jgi:hypothetical protein
MCALGVNRKEGNMNNLQYLYMVNDDFQQFVNSHLVIFERWYADELGETRIEDDIEAHNWLMAERYGSGSDYNDGNLPEPCLRLDFGGEEFNSVELGEGTGFIRIGAANSIIDNLTKELATARSDHETLQLYASELRDLFEKTYALADWIWGHVPVKHIPIEYGRQMNEIYNVMQERGIDVEQIRANLKIGD